MSTRPLTVTAGTPLRQQTTPILFQNNLENWGPNRLPQCPFWATYCNFPLYGRLLQELCPQTCAAAFQKSAFSYSNLRMQNPMFNKNVKRRRRR
ncbi:unnamed protein product [Meloidogyne enterolobii]|uniref:Uncharacterized protein n=1 Tax=Meloidogyne enterolobii TaxID=390850 RepID=A0ACB1AZ06_MELEN